ncbi:P-loop containing nucleoside triphosphate hydrolase protein [Hanseniaspora valbyensis NRRL Y-1626]|uniref:p-loop containing nucleoside triphosphate hydrolase protein n=1 Tax=Hanseniaspora valbyensis NRRL Y-1626 TaxID=766949 RepID=A0A1B7TD09_9ASCO|nr:P-loop containing nucleoside triphosphate hydrolase protein [Hanseniaspora valbyensis NRRL Y-1626]
MSKFDKGVEYMWLQDLERVTASEYLPQKRLFSFFFSNRLPEIAENDDQRTYFPSNEFTPLNFFFFNWVIPILKIGYKRTIQPTDLFKLNENQKIENIHNDFLIHWSSIVSKHKNGDKFNNIAIVFALFKTFKWRYGRAIFYGIISNSAAACIPIVSKKLIDFVEKKHYNVEMSSNKGIGYAFGVALLLYIFAFTMSHSLFNAFVTGGLVRSVLTKSILSKSFKLSTCSRKKFPQALIASMSTTDLNRIENGFAYHSMLYSFPATTAICITQLIRNVGPISLLGCAYFIIALLINIYSFAFIFKFRIKANKKTDIRIGLIREIANSLKIIKFFAWEDAYFDKINESRNSEISQLHKMQTFMSAIIAYGFITATIASMIVFVAIYGINHGLKSPANTFASLAVFQVLSSFIFLIPQIMSHTLNAYVALKRVQVFLLAEEIDPTSLKPELCLENNNAIELYNCSFFWNKEEEVKEEDLVKNSVSKGLKNLSFNIKKGEFVAIVGPIGSGKSSLLYVLSKKLKIINGSIKTTGNLLLNGDPWIQNTTFKNNITFGSKFCKKKYKKIIDVCALNSDLELLSFGDNTEIGERGVTLSGGQKQRLALARTCYKDADIYLFDDVLSAVDAHVGKHIMENCLLKYLDGKTRVLATHQLNFIENADRVIFLNNDFIFTIPEAETENEFSKNEIEDDIGSIISTDSFLDPEDKDITKKEIEKDEIKNGRIMAKEQRAINSIGGKIYKQYLKFGGGDSIWPLTFLGVILSQIINTFCSLFTTVWLSYWSENKFENKLAGFYIGIYIMFTFTSLISTFIFSVITFTFSLNASKKLHSAAVKSILHVPMSFIDTTPIGTIINRFSKDIDVLDNELPLTANFMLNRLFSIFGILIISIIYLPWFAIATPILFFLFFVIRDIYQTTGREVKRLESLQKSFVVNNFQEAMSGLDTIAMFKMEEMFIFKNDFTTNKQNEATMTFQGLQRWSSIWVMLLAVIMTLIICLMCSCNVFNIGAAATGVLINYIIELASALRNMLVQTTAIENHMNSTERVCNYATELDQEAPYKSSNFFFKTERKNWPSSGTIKYENVCMRYRPNLPLVLKNISFEVQNGEKIGICGRTGCGKSSTVSSLFRINELESGSIYIDGVDISKLGLYDLRSSISIIPQESVLFKATIKANLDPFNNHSDEELWNALVKSGAIDSTEIDKVKKQNFTNNSEQIHKFHLYREVEEDGRNFSLGERQLLGLSRAVVKKSRILVLDEATSSVDNVTDYKIQAKIEENFGKNTTVLTIAHRLKTIINYDKILVLDAGKIIEFDSPYKLFMQKGSIFRGLCEKAEINEKEFKKNI